MSNIVNLAAQRNRKTQEAKVAKAEADLAEANELFDLIESFVEENEG